MTYGVLLTSKVATKSSSLHVYIYIYLHIYIFTYLHIYVFTYLHIYIFTYLHIYIQIQVSHTYLHIKAEVTKEFAHDAPVGGHYALFLY